MKKINWPEWWSWEIELSLQVQDRMIDRRFSETDLRTMLEDATAIVPGQEPGRWTVTTIRDRSIWEIIVEPIEQDRILKIVTAYPVD